MTQAMVKALQATSEPFRALVVAFLAVLLRELVPELQEVELEAVLAPLVAYMLAKGLQQSGIKGDRAGERS